MAEALGDALSCLRIQFTIDHRAACNRWEFAGHGSVVIGGALVAKAMGTTPRPVHVTPNRSIT